MVSGGNGIIRTFPPLPRTRNCASLSSRSSSSSARTSHDRNPLSNNKPTTAMSRAVRKLDQNLATCSTDNRSEEHTSELQSPCNLVCRLLLEKKKRQHGGGRDPSLLVAQCPGASGLASLHHPCIRFFFNDTATTEIYTLSLHDALPICQLARPGIGVDRGIAEVADVVGT